jgi:hypothetical protein
MCCQLRGVAGVIIARKIPGCAVRQPDLRDDFRIENAAGIICDLMS